MSNFKKGDRVVFDRQERGGLVGVVTYASQKNLQVDFGYRNGWITNFRQKDGRRTPRGGVDMYIRLATPTEIRLAARGRLRGVFDDYLLGHATAEELAVRIERYEATR